ncbi:M43 family zinc metalloprotease [Soonwooa sp.]|uniref:M43 family zinc metalloprotease n=1 Tax=Soonwooa sp. TaxID=1938592 RepID=UPI002606BF0A|nr:M43 family zinc metalloprotease [Soonwooa sp.]
MKKLLFILTLQFIGMLNAQYTCATDDVQKQIEQKDPQARARRLSADQKLLNMNIQEFLKEKGMKYDQNGKYSGTIYTIPVVVHVIESSDPNNSTFKVSDDQIKTWLDNTNKMYATTYGNGFYSEGSGPDGGTVIPVKLVLAKRTPTNAMTNGIVRYNGSGLQGYDAQGLDANSLATTPNSAGKVRNLAKHWDEKKYFNIYVITFFGGDRTTYGLMGWAAYPSFPNDVYDSFMKVAAVTNNNNSTLAHEFGHAMGLIHVFGNADSNGGVCPDNADCMTDNDKVCDTAPTQSLLNSNPTPSNSDINPCTGQKYDGVQYNIMNYTRSIRKFTPGQRDRAMAQFLNSEYGTLASSNGATPPPIYVKQNTSGDGSGSSWNNAKNLTDALYWADNNRNLFWDNEHPLQIWVAKGYHVPTYQYGGGAARDKTFSLVPNVQLYGGFNGDETRLDQRKPSVNETVLNGDKVSSHVVVSNGDVGSALLDGFTIWNGYANDNKSFDINGYKVDHRYGGGMSINHSSPVIMNCLFKDNYSVNRGGGVYICNYSKPVFENVVFMQNEANLNSGDGGAIYVYDNNTELTLLNCTITNNKANDGGGIRFDSSMPVYFRNNIFYNNTSKNSPNSKNSEISFNYNENNFWNINQTTVDKNIFQYTIRGNNSMNIDPKIVNGFELDASSPAINLGWNSLYTDPSAVIPKSTIDVVGKARIMDGSIDLGAWERPCYLGAPMADNTKYTFCFSGKISDLVAKINNGLIKIYANSNDYDPLPTTDNLVNNKTYYALKYNDNNCTSNRVPIQVVIDSPTAPTLVSAPTDTCEGSLTLGGVNLSGTNIKWYDAQTGGNLLPANTIVRNNVKYYASQTTSNSCESTRYMFSKALSLQPTVPTGQASQNFPEGAVISDIVVSGQNVKWFDTQANAENNANPLANNTVLVTKKYYAISVSTAGCRSIPKEFSITVEKVLGTENASKEGIAVYPNPVKDVLNIVNNTNISKIMIFDAVGKLISETHHNEKTVSVNVRNLPVGSYMLSIYSEGKVTSKKIIKN